MKKALVVGINNYPLCPLFGCIHDAEAVRDILSKNEDGSPNFSVRLETDVPSKGHLRALIQECFEGTDDVALFYYSGHGQIDSVGGYLVTPDYSNGDYGVSLQDVLNIANSSKCKNRIIILDSCYSGFAGTITSVAQNTSIINNGVTILTACLSSQPAVESNGHGIFTSLLLEALQGSAADVTGNITPGGVYAYIDKALGPWDQRPVFKTNVSQFISLRNVKPQIDITIIRRLCKYFSAEDSSFLLDPSYEPTNSPDVDHRVILPYADAEHTAIFHDLQQLESIGLVVPIGEEHMYFAAMKSKPCQLTAIGKQYWRLVARELI